MRIEGIGVINKNKALSILTKEGREAVKEYNKMWNRVANWP